MPTLKAEDPKALEADNGSKTAKEPNARWWVKVLLFLHVVAITSWALPKAPNGMMNGTVPLGVNSDSLLYLNDKYMKSSPEALYVLATGTWQSWDMFSPNPANTDIWCDAKVTFRNGSEMVYQYPRIYNLPLLIKYPKERFRKFFEHANTDERLWPTFARTVALQVYEDRNNPPTKVVLRRHFYQIPKEKPFNVYCFELWNSVKARKVTMENLLPSNPQIPPYSEYEYFTYKVNQAELDNLR